MAKNKKSIINFKLIIIFFCIGIIGSIGKDVFIAHFFNKRLTVVPNVLNLSEKDAVKYLKKAGLKVKINYSKTEKVPLDTVFIQHPEAGKEIKVNRTIQIWVNNGEGNEVPNIVGLELLEARSILQEQNIEIERIDYQPSNEKYNTIIGVYPEIGTKLDVNQKITLLVSSQKVTDPSSMPNIIGLDLNNAKVLLEKVGLRAGKVSYGEDAGLPVNVIISTNPAPGSPITKGQSVSFVINKGIKVETNEPSVEEIINETNKEFENKQIENIINETLNKLNNKDTTDVNKDANKENNSGQ